MKTINVAFTHTVPLAVVPGPIMPLHVVRHLFKNGQVSVTQSQSKNRARKKNKRNMLEFNAPG